MTQLIFWVNSADLTKKTQLRDFLSFPMTTRIKFFREIRDSSTKENTRESMIHEPNFSTTTSNEKKKKNKFETSPWPFQKPLKREIFDLVSRRCCNDDWTPARQPLSLQLWLCGTSQCVGQGPTICKTWCIGSLGKTSQQIKVKFDLPYLNQHTHIAIVTPYWDYIFNLLNQII